MRSSIVLDTLGTEGLDFVLKSDSAWITVKKFSVYLRKTDEGILVDVYKKGKEMEGSISSAYAFDSEIT